MKIAVNARLLLPGKLEGIGWFASETLKRITLSHPEHQFLFLFDRPFSPGFIFSSNIAPVVIAPQARHPLLWYHWFEYSVPRILSNMKADLFFSPDGYLSLSSEVPSVPVIHDINFMHYRGFHPWLTGRYYRYFFPRFAARARRIVTVSEYSSADISRTFGIKNEKIDVVYNGVKGIFTPLQEEEKTEVRNDIACGEEYFIFVGSFHERKNIIGLLCAYESFRHKLPCNIKLVLVGEKMYKYSQMENTLKGMKFREDVIFTGRMEPPELRRTYGAAIALVFIPWFEGFGVPVIEAMSCDTPVIISNRASLPEVAGNAAHVVDPVNTESVVDGMIRIATDKGYRKKLINLARIRRQSFSWERTARLLWKSLESAAAYEEK